MCGIVGAVAQRNVNPILLEGLRRLEYRGYDSAGIAVINSQNQIERIRLPGKVQNLANAIEQSHIAGEIGIAHTRWATHGKPTEKNAHPHVCRNRVAVVHNGIIENHETLREQQTTENYLFTSETDTEVISHQIFKYLEQGNDLLAAVQLTATDLEGAFALAVISIDDPKRMVVVRRGSPLVIGIGIGEYFIASDVSALLPVTRKFIFLEEGDIADIRINQLTILDDMGVEIEREKRESDMVADAVERGEFRHYMLKEIYEQPIAIANTLESRIVSNHVIEESFGVDAHQLFDQVQRVKIIACGTSFHAGSVARYWMEQIAGIACSVEVASEFRYRKPVIEAGTLVITISQSGETADTLAALREAKLIGISGSLAICNVPESSLVRESDLVLMTRAGPEIGVASTKAFTTQLVALMLTVIVLGRRHKMSDEVEQAIIHDFEQLPRKVEQVLEMDSAIKKIAESFADKRHALFLGRGVHYPIAMEGALKLKEISYIHAESYPAGELKHGPLALVDEDMPVVAVAPNDALLEKLKSNLKEVKARGGQLIVFADSATKWIDEPGVHVEAIQPVEEYIAPIIFTIPLQLLSYYVALLKGTDVDQPRNLAKSVTVE
jgi:glucosamine--fructose-6-phosphate aminotransferase (isomerizing)